ncbi:hypothetical protein [Fodinibius salsisoli]|uniref:Uncharacterized protein n=1 Tax=Fodinibius salsisoli TaxID=2820877 RepID=A0ABT3PKG8_9BACT|nr:hypothetical protein [Fodinibius salsisoli]MCW9706426.1 hypothetical protein [Fodinibius salsisoli]
MIPEEQEKRREQEEDDPGKGEGKAEDHGFYATKDSIYRPDESCLNNQQEAHKYTFSVRHGTLFPVYPIRLSKN